MIEHDLLFSMDIGTRTVVGIVGYHDGETFKILDFEVEEHKERAMYDGQVHDIDLVAKAAQKVKEKLEKRLDIKLSRVSVAAAGRSLKTCKVFVERETDLLIEIDKELISSLEIEAIQQAQKEIEQQNDEDVSYYCAGYAVVNYFLNGNIIGNLEGHKGKKAGIEVLSTFLPKVVVDSLYSVVARIGLEVSSLTLEPIAAMNVSIHSNLRLLNIALVDIGAGTSDIALTKAGTVFAFAMAPIAGDEITEKLAENFLLDFDAAEKVKISLSKKSSIKFKDVMGLSYEKTSDEIVESIKSVIQMLAKEIADKIYEYNGKSPSAVFLIGGGSQVPLLPSYIAEYLQIPVERVGVRKADIIRDVEIKSKKLAGPEFITPIGIAVTAYLNRQKDFLQVSVNDKVIKLFNSKTLTIADALILVGYNPRNLIGRRGEAVTYKLNGITEVVKGEPGEPAKIMLNGVLSGLDKTILNGDKITIDPAVEGKPTKVYVKDLLHSFQAKSVFVDDKRYELEPSVTINGTLASLESQVKDGDKVEIKEAATLLDLIRYFDIADSNLSFKINGKPVGKEDTISNGDIVTFEKQDENENHNENPDNNGIAVYVNGKMLRLNENGKSQYMFLDIFNYIDINPRDVKGTIYMRLNGKSANYTDLLKNGDTLEIQWQ